MCTPPMDYRAGIPEDDRLRVAELIDEAFAGKLRFAIPDDQERLGVLTSGLRLDAAIGAYEGQRLVGVAGIKTHDRGLFDPITFRLLQQELGLGVVRAALVLQLLDRSVAKGTIYIELIAVDENMRGRGVGTGLLSSVEALGCLIGATRMELAVVDTNPDAHRLYLRQGFVDAHTDTLPFPSSWMGFGSSTTMYRAIDCFGVGTLEKHAE